MATRLRKTRRLRGGRHMGWGQVAQHRSFGHKGGLGRSGHLKHLASTVIKEDQDHFGHEGTHSPHPSITKVWINIRDLNDLFAKSGKSENSKNVLEKVTDNIEKSVPLLKTVDDAYDALIQKEYDIEMNVPLLLESKIGDNWLDIKDV